MKNKLLFLIVFFWGVNLLAQNNNFEPSKTQFMIRGYGHTGLNYTNTEGDKELSFFGSEFSPIFLFKQSDKLMFETELEFEYEGNDLDIGVEYADVMYVLHKNLTVRAGKFLLPFGTFFERLHPAWINKFGSKPLGFDDDGITPESDMGVEFRGAFDLDGPKLNYAVYAVNGPRLIDGSDEPDEAGMLLFQNFEDNNISKAFGGRIGLLPFSDSSTELGFSVYSTNGAGDKDSAYEKTGVFMYALDFSFVKQIEAVRGFLDVKAQYNNSKIDTARYTDDLEETYSFDNKSNAFYAQLSYRPTMFESDCIKKLEFVGRYSNYNAPTGALWAGKSDQYAFGINYWLNWRSVIKASYQTTDTKRMNDVLGTINTEGFYLHWAIGF